MTRTAQAAATMIAIPISMPPHPRTPTCRRVPRDRSPLTSAITRSVRTTWPRHHSRGSLCPLRGDTEARFIPTREDRTRKVSHGKKGIDRTQIAELRQLSIDTVKSQLSRGRKALIALLSDAEAGVA